MKCEIVIDPNAEEKVVVYAKEEHTLVREIKRLTEERSSALIGYRDREMVPLDPTEIYCVAVVGNKVYAIYEKEQFLLRERLYMLKERLPSYFVKVNQSCLANIKKIERFDASISGTLKIRFQNGYIDYVSRRQLKVLKERIGI